MAGNTITIPCVGVSVDEVESLILCKEAEGYTLLHREQKRGRLNALVFKKNCGYNG